MTDLHTDYLGLRLRSPIVASAGPYSGDLDKVAEMQDAGVGAVVMPSLFEEQIENETTEIDRLFSMHHDSFGEAESFFPELDDYQSGTDRYVGLLEDLKQRVDVPVIASLNGTNPGGWIRYARMLEDAGADAVELNLYTVAADPAISGSALESEQIELVSVLANEIDLPVAVKISPHYSSLASFLLDLQEAGADGVVLFNRFYAPDLNLETLDVEPKITLSTESEVRLPLRWAGIAREFLHISIAASSGVHTGWSVAKLILAGADVTMTTSALLVKGPDHIRTMEGELREFMAEMGYTSVSEMRGAVSRDSAADPAAYERANYIGNLATYASRFLGAKPIGLQHR